jgi:hypothetical protein
MENFVEHLIDQFESEGGSAANLCEILKTLFLLSVDCSCTYSAFNTDSTLLD